VRDWLDNAYRVPVIDSEPPEVDTMDVDTCGHCGRGKLELSEVVKEPVFGTSDVITSEIMVCNECESVVERMVNP